jgi:hypothetical protein
MSPPRAGGKGCRSYRAYVADQHMIVDESAKLMTKVAALSSDEGEQKKAIAEFIFLHEQLAQVNEYLADVLLKLSFETGLDWRHQFQKLQSESVFYEQVQQLIANKRSRREVTRINRTKTLARGRRVLLSRIREVEKAGGLELNLSGLALGATVFIAVDQFEELLARAAGSMAAKLLRFLRGLLNCRNGQLLVIGILRSDHLDLYKQSPDAPQDFFQSWRVGPFPPQRIPPFVGQICK